MDNAPDHAGGDPYARYPDGFFRRRDEGDDARFYAPSRLVTHIDDAAVAAVGELYDELGVTGEVLDLMGSWVSHFRRTPDRLVVQGMNAAELAANEQAAATLVHDLNADPVLPFDDDTFDDAVCCVSIDYLTRPFEVVAQVARVVRPGGRFVVTFSNRCFPTKAVLGWLAGDDDSHVAYVRDLLTTAGFADVVHQRRDDGRRRRDPLHAVWGTVPDA
jgi:SAM-dependent methyltransferase